MSDPVREAGLLVSRAKRPVVVSHVRPDGDAIGSLLGTVTALVERGIAATPVMRDGLPRRFRFLPSSDRVQSDLPSDTDLVICVDCSDLERTGFSPGAYPRHPDINIDHHPTNTNFAKINIVQVEAAATTEILYHAFPRWKLPISTDVASCLLTGLVTDTIGFRTSSTTPAALRTAADLLELGPDLPLIYQKSLTDLSFTAAQYWGRGLGRLEYEDGLLWTSLTLEDRSTVGYPGPDDADLVSLMTTIESVSVTVIFVEQTGGKVKVSWRAQPGINVARVATEFGGGGHEPAAGAMVEGDLQDVQQRVLKATRHLIEESQRKPE